MRLPMLNPPLPLTGAARAVQPGLRPTAPSALHAAATALQPLALPCLLLDRWLGPRALQAPALLAAVTALCWLSAHAATLREPALAWLAFALPLLALGTGWLLAGLAEAGRMTPGPCCRRHAC